jgi:hypothetical protein
MAAPLERDIQRAICDYLSLRGHFYWRQNTAPAFDWKSNRFRRMAKHTRKGVPDIILIKDGKPYFLEVKRPKTYQSADQKIFEQEATAAGAVYAVLRSVDDAVALGL